VERMIAAFEIQATSLSPFHEQIFSPHLFLFLTVDLLRQPSTYTPPLWKPYETQIFSAEFNLMNTCDGLSIKKYDPMDDYSIDSAIPQLRPMSYLQPMPVLWFGWATPQWYVESRLKYLNLI
jgi:hypothetical protein